LKGHTEGVNSIAFLRGGRQLLSGSADGMVKRWNVLSGKLEMSAGGHKGGVMAVAAGPRDSVASGSFDASIKLRPATLTQPGGELLAIDRADWVVLSPDGRFDGSPDGLRLVHYVQNNQPIPLDSLFEKLFTPKLLRELTEGRATASALPKSAAAPNGSGGFKKGAAIRPQPARPASSSEAYAPAATLKLDTSKPFAPPPLVKISTPDKTAQSAGPPGAPTDRTRGIGVENLEDARTPITIEITDQGGGLDSVRLYHNEKLFAEERLDAGATTEGGKVSKTFYVALAPGVNEFAATALNRERTESQPARTRVEVASMQPVVNLYIVSVGLNQYQNAKYNLNYGRTDADSFAREIEKRARGIFKQVDKQVIFDTQATRAGIEAAFERVAAAAQPQDAFVFYFAGHGVMSEGDAQTPADFHLVPYDVTQLYGDDRQLSLKAISARRLKELCTKVRAQKQLIVFDACQSGGAVEAFATYRGASEEKAILQLARSAGVVVLAASGTEQLAAEFPKLGHGVFTYALLQGLSGEADGGAQPDGKITVKELEAFLNDMVPELSRRYRGKPQYPNSYARGQDFPISIK
ncbi:MAG: caspase family protein, partial [Pyrinomonadaceae bacterium]